MLRGRGSFLLLLSLASCSSRTFLLRDAGTVTETTVADAGSDAVTEDVSAVDAIDVADASVDVASESLTDVLVETASEVSVDVVSEVALDADAGDVREDVAPDVVPDVVSDVRPDVVSGSVPMGTTLVTVPLISTLTSARFGDNQSGELSADGRYVVFSSTSVNLTSEGLNEGADIFLRDLVLGQTRILTLATDGNASDGTSWNPKITPNGRYVVFMSTSQNLVPMDTNFGPNMSQDVFLKDLATNQVQLVSLNWEGVQVPATSIDNAFVSNNGRYLVFQCAQELGTPARTTPAGDVWVRDLAATAPTTRLLSIGPMSQRVIQSIGGSCAAGETNAGHNVFLTSFSNANLEAGFNTWANWPDMERTFCHNSYSRRVDDVTAPIQPIGVRPGGAAVRGQSGGQLSDDGRFAVIESIDPMLVSGDGNNAFDVFRRTRADGSIVRVSRARDGISETNGLSVGGQISADGSVIAFQSTASNLVADDTNGVTDIFVWEAASGNIRRVNLNGTSTEQVPSGSASRILALSDDGSVVLFATTARLDPRDNNDLQDLYVHRWR